MKRFFISLSLISAFVLITTSVLMAQPLPPAGANHEGAPIDGFSLLLIVVSVLYGAYAIRKREKTEAA